MTNDRKMVVFLRDSILDKVEFRKELGLNEDDFVEVFYLFSREIEHNLVFLPNIYKDIKEAGYDTLAYMTILVR